MGGLGIAYIAPAILVLWGVAFILPVREVMHSLGAMSPDGRRIIATEWVAEGMALTFIGLLNLILLMAAGGVDPTVALAMRVSAGALAILALWMLVAGFRTRALAIKLCPLVLAGVAVLMVAGTFV